MLHHIWPTEGHSIGGCRVGRISHSQWWCLSQTANKGKGVYTSCTTKMEWSTDVVHVTTLELVPTCLRWAQLLAMPCLPHQSSVSFAVTRQQCLRPRVLLNCRRTTHELHWICAILRTSAASRKFRNMTCEKQFSLFHQGQQVARMISVLNT